MLMNGPKRPSAVLADNDLLALGALRWCHKHGVRIPDDLAIMGYDNIAFTEFGELRCRR